MNITAVNESSTEANCFKCISWSAIFVGALVAIGLSFIVYLFTSGLELSIFTTNSAGLISLAVGTFIWLIFASYISMFIAGLIAGLLARPNNHRCGLGVLHGFTAWCLSLVIVSVLALHSSFLMVTAGTSQLAERNQPSIQMTNSPSAPAITTDNSNSSNTQVLVNPEKQHTVWELGSLLPSLFS